MPSLSSLVPLSEEILSRPEAVMRTEVERMGVIVADGCPPVLDPYAYVLAVTGAYWGVGTPAGFC